MNKPAFSESLEKAIVAYGSACVEYPKTPMTTIADLRYALDSEIIKAIEAAKSSGDKSRVSLSIEKAIVAYGSACVEYPKTPMTTIADLRYALDSEIIKAIEAAKSSGDKSRVSLSIEMVAYGSACVEYPKTPMTTIADLRYALDSEIIKAIEAAKSSGDKSRVSLSIEMVANIMRAE